MSDKGPEEYLWRPQADKWNLQEIVCHLLDEEREDFRARVKHTLENPLKKMTFINPKRWVVERAYASKNYKETLDAFLDERHQSVRWLSELKNENWENSYPHPKRGNMSAELFLTNWLAHDYLHIRQIIRYQYHYLKENTAVNLSYAGTW